jgi:hypothetical protein
MYDSALRYGAAVAADGSLPAAGEAPGLRKESRGSWSPFPDAHSTPARVSRPVDGSAAGKLADAGGIAALLRR